MNYFGTDLSSAGHHLWELEVSGMYSSRMQLATLPFNPEGLPYRAFGEITIQDGDALFYRCFGFTICAIEGSCHDKRAGSKSIFFVRGNLTDLEMKDRILSIPVARKIIEKMSFKVKWEILI